MDTNAQTVEELAAANPGLSPERIIKHLLQVKANDLANADPLPGPLMAAFASMPLEHAGIRLRKLVASDIIILKQLDSPLYKQMLEAHKPAEERAATKWEDEEAAEMVFQFTIAPAQVRALLAKGRPAFREAALAAVTDKLVNPQDLKTLVEMTVLNLFQAFATTIKYEHPKPGGTEVFTPPPPAPATGSAGGSTT